MECSIYERRFLSMTEPPLSNRVVEVDEWLRFY